MRETRTPSPTTLCQSLVKQSRFARPPLQIAARNPPQLVHSFNRPRVIRARSAGRGSAFDSEHRRIRLVALLGQPASISTRRQRSGIQNLGELWNRDYGFFARMPRPSLKDAATGVVGFRRQVATADSAALPTAARRDAKDSINWVCCQTRASLSRRTFRTSICPGHTGRDYARAIRNVRNKINGAKPQRRSSSLLLLPHIYRDID